MMLDFTGQTVVVTGGGSGIGAASCALFAEQGATVYVADVNADSAATVVKTITDSGGAATELVFDVADFESCNREIDRVVEETGNLDALVLCAGWAETHPFIGEDPEYWKRVVDINLFGTIYPTHAALRHMLEAKYGRIVTVSSDAGRVGTLGETVYAGAKGGVVAFTKSIAREVGRSGIVANSIAPGVTDTPLMRHQDQSVIDKMVRLVTLKRLGNPDEVVAALVFLASKEASFITGQVISVSGGLTMVG
jgi:NAD(P)-dependent dehydrogenase (short-subunit alcohol dehydrogenase family)